jgi:hypothetical protein
MIRGTSSLREYFASPPGQCFMLNEKASTVSLVTFLGLPPNIFSSSLFAGKKSPFIPALNEVCALLTAGAAAKAAADAAKKNIANSENIFFIFVLLYIM